MRAMFSHGRHDKREERADAEAASASPASQSAPVAAVPKLAQGNVRDDEDKDTDVALELLRALADQELARSERSASRARQVFALAAGFFAVVQTVAFGGFAANLIGTQEREVLLILAGVAGAFLAVCGVALLIADRAFRSANLTSDNILNSLNDASGEPARYRFIELYARVVDELRAANSNRQSVVVATQALGLLSVGAVLVELVYSLYARLS